MPQSVLLVDDEPQLLFSLNEYLTQVGYNVTPAGSGAEALDALVDAPPDFIISDIMMEDMDGFEFQRRVVSLTGDSIPFIFLTARDNMDDRISGLRNGADDYITKPFEPEELEARIATIMHRVDQIRREERRDSDNLRERIVAEMSGRLRAPVTNLMAHLNLLLSERFGDDDQSKQRYLESALRDANTLCALVDEINRAPDGQPAVSATIKREPIRIAPIVRRAAANAARIANEQGIELRITCGGLLSGNVDGEALAKALAALLKATVDFSAPGSRVEISARRAAEGGLEFVIQDDGRRAVSAEQSNQELNDALDLGRRVVKAHGGQITLVRADDGPQRFCIWLPGRVAKHIGKRQS